MSREIWFALLACVLGALSSVVAGALMETLRILSNRARRKTVFGRLKSGQVLATIQQYMWHTPSSKESGDAVVW